MKKHAFFTGVLLTALLQAVSFEPLFSQSFLTTRLDGAGAGHAFLDISETTREHIINGTFDGTIEYLPSHGPFQVEVVDPATFVPGDYQLELVDADLTDSLLQGDIYWRLTNLNTGLQVLSPLPIHVMAVQEAPALGVRVKIVDFPVLGQPLPNNGAIGATITYESPDGPHWLEGIPDDYDPVHLNFVDPSLFNNSYTQLGDGYFVPFQLGRYTSINNSPLYNFISPVWLDDEVSLVIPAPSNSVHETLNNVDIVFTSDKSKWSRCVVVESAMLNYSLQLNLATQNTPGLGCDEIKQFDLRAAPSVGIDDANGDGLPDPDGDGFGMAWFPGYAIDVETGQRVNLFFGENSAYSFDQAPYLLDLYGIAPSDFETPPTGLDMMWNPSSQIMVDAGDSTGFPYPYYLGGQHFIYVTNQPYDACEYIRGRLTCNETDLKKVNAIKRITWCGIPILAEGSSLLSYAEGLIPNEATVKLRVDHAFQVKTGTDDFNGYPTYRFNLSFSAAAEAAAVADRPTISPNPCILRGNEPLWLNNLPNGSEVSLFSPAGKLLSRIDSKDLGNAHQGPADIRGLFPQHPAPGVYFVLVSRGGFQLKVASVVVL